MTELFGADLPDCFFGFQDVTDLFGADLPVEGGRGGAFAWRDGPFLQALKAGHWVVFDEVCPSFILVGQFYNLLSTHAAGHCVIFEEVPLLLVSFITFCAPMKPGTVLSLKRFHCFWSVYNLPSIHKTGPWAVFGKVCPSLSVVGWFNLLSIPGTGPWVFLSKVCHCFIVIDQHSFHPDQLSAL